MNISKSALNSLITHLQRVVERAKAEPQDCRTQDIVLLIIYFIHPFKGKKEWRMPDFHNEDGVGAKRIDSDLFPSVQWEDEEPTEAYIALAEPQEQTKQEQSTQEHKIDWEQRRYEIAMELLPLLYRKSAETLTLEDAVDGALNFADTLIAKLKSKANE